MVLIHWEENKILVSRIGLDEAKTNVWTVDVARFTFMLRATWIPLFDSVYIAFRSLLSSFLACSSTATKGKIVIAVGGVVHLSALLLCQRQFGSVLTNGNLDCTGSEVPIHPKSELKARILRVGGYTNQSVIQSGMMPRSLKGGKGCDIPTRIALLTGQGFTPCFRASASRINNFSLREIPKEVYIRKC